MVSAWQSDLDHLRWLKTLGIESFKDKKILDLGCGSGFLCQKAMTEGANKAVGIDLVPPKGMSQTDWSFLKVDLDSTGWFQFVPEKFHYIFAFDIIEHVQSPYQFVKSCYELLDRDGVLVLTTPNLSSWEKFINPRGWSGVRDEQHKTLFNSYSLSFLLGKAGFAQVTTKAPMRKLSFLGPLQPNVGGQIFCSARI